MLFRALPPHAPACVFWPGGPRELHPRASALARRQHGATVRGRAACPLLNKHGLARLEGAFPGWTTPRGAIFAMNEGAVCSPGSLASCHCCCAESKPDTQSAAWPKPNICAEQLGTAHGTAGHHRDTWALPQVGSAQVNIWALGEKLVTMGVPGHGHS